VLHSVYKDGSMNSECKLLFRSLFFFCSLFFFIISSFSSSSAQSFYTKSKNGVLHFTNVPPQEKGYRRFKLPWKTSLRGYGGRSPGSFKYSNRFDDHIYTTARLYGIEPMLIKAMIKVESNFNPKAVSPKGAMGVMQLMPQTARRNGVRNPYDPAQNIIGGVKYFKMLTNTFNGDLRLALAGYNAGEDAVIQYGYQIPPYRETINYVDRVLTHYNHLKNNYSINGKKSIIKPQKFETLNLPTSISNLPNSKKPGDNGVLQNQGMVRTADLLPYD